MATYGQWNAKRPLRRLAWVCGPEQVLAAEVTRAYWDAASGRSSCILFAGLVDETEVWDAVLTMPPSGGRLIVVHNAEKLTRKNLFGVLAEAEGLETAFTVFISAESDFARDGKELAPHLTAFRDAKDAQLIRCVAPSDEEKLLAVIMQWWEGSGANVAHELLRRCGGDLSLVRQACLKAEYAGLPPESQSVALVAEQMPATGYVSALIAGDTRTAAATAGLLYGRDIGSALGLLASRLGQLAVLRDAIDRGMTSQEIASKLKMERFIQHELRPHAPRYGPDRVAACRRVLALAETAYRTGASVGVPEVVAALW